MSFPFIQPTLHSDKTWHFSICHREMTLKDVHICTFTERESSSLTAVYSSTNAISPHSGLNFSSVRIIVLHLFYHWVFQVTNKHTRRLTGCSQQNYTTFPVWAFKIRLFADVYHLPSEYKFYILYCVFMTLQLIQALHIFTHFKLRSFQTFFV